MRSGLVVAALLATVAPAAADDFAGWRYTPPSGYETKDSGDLMVIQKITPPTFCLIMLYRPRASSQSLAAEAAAEWKTNVEQNFTTSGVKHHGKGTTRSKLAFHATAGTAEDQSGNKLAAILYAVSASKQVGSVLLMSNNSDEIKTCRPALTSFLDSLTLTTGATDAPSPAPAALSIAGTWSNSASFVDGRTGMSNSGSIKRQYVFAADGTYRFYSEAWGGHYESETWRLVKETGTYKLAGEALTIAPDKVIGTVHKKGVTSTFKPPVEKTLYAVKKHFFEGIKEWNLVLTPSKKTARDGEYATTDAFKDSYLYSDTYKPEWKYPP